jgi:hypothetical protein
MSASSSQSPIVDNLSHSESELIFTSEVAHKSKNLNGVKMARPKKELANAGAPTDVSTTSNVTPKRTMRGQREFEIDTFKLRPASFQKNVSWKKNEPRLEDVTHNHFFFSHDKHGNKLDNCVAVGGHTHPMTWGVDSNGEPTAVCGAPIRERMVKRGQRIIKVMEPVEFYSNELGRPIVDNHTHDVDYLHSEVLTAQSVKQYAQRAREEILSAATSSPSAPSTQHTKRLPLAGDIDLEDMPMDLG